MKRSRLDDLVRAERRAPPRPSGAEARATWARIEHDLAVAAAPVPIDVAPASVAPVAKTGAFASLTAKVTLVTAVSGGAVVGVSLGEQAATERRPAPVGSVDGGQEPASETPRAGSEMQAASSDSAPTASDDAVAPMPPVPAEDARAEAAPVRRVVTRPARREPAKDPPRPPEGIGRELDLVKRAGQALSAGDHPSALRLLDQHAREFPEGTMAEDRSALRVLTLCAAGRADEGRRAKDRFLARWPRSVHADRLEDGCRTSNEE